MVEFATKTQITEAHSSYQEWAKSFPEAAEALQRLWTEHFLKVGHKRLGRMVIGIKLGALVVKAWESEREE